MRFSIEAEQSVIGGLLLDNKKLDDVTEVIAPEDFYNIDHQAIFGAMMAMANSSKVIDVVTLAEKMYEDGTLEQIGGIGYLVEIANNTPSAANILSYARVIADRAMERKISEAGQRIYELGESDGDVDEKLNALHSEMAALERKDDLGYLGIQDMLKGLIKQMEDKQQGLGKAGLKTGFKALDDRFMGIEETDLWILAARPAMGKELTNDSPVLLSNGVFKPIGEIMVGDIVASVDGKESIVSGHFPQGLKPVYRVTFSDGRYVDSGLEHQWEVNHRKWQSPRVMTTREIIEKIKMPDYKSRLFIPNHSSDFGCDEGIVIHPYLMGVLIGNGGLSAGGVKFSSCQSHILEKIKPMLLGCDLVESGNDYRISTRRGQNNRVIEELKKLGLYGMKSVEKFIPDIYLRASKESRIELMRGLIDTDGTVEKTGSMTYSTSSERLSSDFISLARSLGAFASVSSRIPKFSYRGEIKQGQRNYCIYISSDDYGQFVTVPHKKSRIKNDKSSRNLNIESIEYIGDFECSCISVTHERSLYLTKDYIVTHNTALALNIVNNVALHGKDVLVFSLEMSKEQLVMRMLSAAAQTSYQKLRDADTKMEIGNIANGVKTLMNQKIHIIDIPAIDVNRALAIARKYARNGNLGLIVIDYLQLMTVKSNSRFDEVSQISRQLKVMAKTVKAPVIALSQLSRKCEERSDKRPNNSDLRESGQIEQDADIITFIYRDEVYNENTLNRGMAELITTKFRNGEIGKDILATELQFCRFKNLSDDFYYKEDEPSYESASKKFK